MAHSGWESLACLQWLESRPTDSLWALGLFGSLLAFALFRIRSEMGAPAAKCAEVLLTIMQAGFVEGLGRLK